MPYEYKRYEWELLPDEQDGARFILDECRIHAQRKVHGIVEQDLVHEGAFRTFKDAFYASVCQRLKIQVANWWGAEGFNSFGISDDGTKLISQKVERIP